MTSPRFYVPEIYGIQQVDLTPEDSRHAMNVLRMRAGDRVTLFDGEGRVADGEIVSSVRSQVTVVIAASRMVCREVPKRLDLLVSLPKGDRQKQLIDMLVQLGVYSLTPLVCRRSVAQPTDNALDRLRRAVIESSKQCGRNQLMRIQPPIELSELCKAEQLAQSNSRRHFLHPYGNCLDLCSAFESPLEEHESTTAVLIGPEGGFSEDEVQALLDAHWSQVHLGRRILRIETAAVAVAATWAAWHDRTNV